MLIPEFRNQLAQAKGSLPKTLHGAGNTAIAKVEIEGLDTKTLAAHSSNKYCSKWFYWKW